MKTVQGPIHSVLCTCHLCEEWREKQKSQRIDDAYIQAARNYTNDPGTADGEGYNGKCGNCADKEVS